MDALTGGSWWSMGATELEPPRAPARETRVDEAEGARLHGANAMGPAAAWTLEAYKAAQWQAPAPVPPLPATPCPPPITDPEAGGVP